MPYLIYIGQKCLKVKKYRFLFLGILYLQTYGQTDSSLADWFRGGTFKGHFRYVNSVTINEGKSKDYYANALGGGVRYETPEHKGFTGAISGYYIFNVGSTDLTTPDSISNSSNRYEIGLFDMEHPDNKMDMDRLEEFYVQYHQRNLRFKLGRQLIESPLVNGQDGRMRPTELSGITTNYSIKKHTLSLNYFWAASPRGTTRWSPIEEAMGIWPQGYDAEGDKLHYHGTIDSKGLFAIADEIRFKKSSFSYWAYWIENVHETNYLEYKQEIAKDSNTTFNVCVQGILQYGTTNRGTNTYLRIGHRSQVMGIKVSLLRKQNSYFIASNYFFGGDPFLFPRELGREPFYAVFTRERLEGCASALALAIGDEIRWKPAKTLLSIAYYKLPNPMDPAKNRYKVPSMVHLNLRNTFHFEKYLHGMDLSWLITLKLAEKQGLSDDLLANKANMFHSALVLNYHF